MALALKLVLALSLLANALLVWAYASAQQEAAHLRGDAERIQAQLTDLGGELRAARAEAAELRAENSAGGEPALAGQAVPPEVLANLHGIEDSVMALRGLTPKQNVPIVFMDRDQLRQYFQESFDREYSPEERVQDQKLLSYIGLIPTSFDLPSFLVDLLGEQVVGFYDDDRKNMALIGEASELSAQERMTFAHEYTHTLQDQHFDLKKLNPPNPENDDESLAIQALVEGDATLLMELWAGQHLSRSEREQAAQGANDDRALRQAPLVLRTELLFPYIDGARFVRVLYDQGGYAAIDEVFRNPPKSTEQILHPDKYRQGHEPIPVQLAATDEVFGAGWSDVSSNTLGELDLRVLVEQFTDRQTANRAAAGWGGDRYRLVERQDGQLGFILQTVWDTPTDADEFASALSQGLRKRFGVGRNDAADDGRVLIPDTTQPSLVVKRGSEVVLLMGPDEATVIKVASALGF